MRPDTQRTFNVSVGATSAVLGLAAWALAAYVAVTPAPPRPAPVSLAPVMDLQSCVQVLASLGLPGNVRNNQVTVNRPGLDDDMEALLQRVSLGIATCRLKLSQFCLGEECPSEGLSFTLTPPTREPAAAASAKGELPAAAPVKKG